VEYALGVPMPHIRADYLATNLFVRDVAEGILDALAGHGLLEHVDLDVDSIFYADMDYLDAALEAVEQECGGMDAYLAAVLGVGERERERLRELYLQ
ncbi:MAG: tyrosine-protein phosphatase, partial [Bacteroidales bacterium]